ncbi:winged helix-turn-helix domain-containing protein [Conexibacter sp. CPCC 206217]|uniref:winged helix-turn-helix domain-containing protein n=1 Tax=Conexibacter sp. CPCC 206217 TaxID=3064574 RepID=UPI00271A6FF0|nr:winged helix-turn-helix domain-containing protein [Conexibacter sp. CPCC 206217]MDO8213892.1 winged helix-turn-helix domain-containing protein [Conexibacter sp. CPCC 206217]
MEIAIDRLRRDALHAEAVLSFGEIATAFESDDYELAQALRPRLEAVSRLLDDIGWDAEDEGDRFVLTMPDAQLALALGYLGGRALARLRAWSDDAPIGPLAAIDGFTEDAEACSHVLAIVTDAAARLPGFLNVLGIGLSSVGVLDTPGFDVIVLDTEDARRPAFLAAPWQINREQRDRLRMQTFIDLGPLTESLSAAIRSGDFAHARETRTRLETDWLLLDQIGWAAIDPRDTYSLSLPPLARDRAQERLRWAEAQGTVPSLLHVGPLMIDARKRAVTLDDRPVELTPTEFNLLRILASDPHRVFHRSELLNTVWGYRDATSTRTLDTHAIRLRQKLGGDGGTWIVNERAIGYKLLADTPSDARPVGVGGEPLSATPPSDAPNRCLGADGRGKV